MNKAKIPKAPRARVCYICGRQYMLHSFSIHEKQCRELFEKWESQKPLKERRRCPEDPMKNSNLILGKTSGGERMSTRELNELNDAARKAWSTECLVRCQNCDRSFLPEKLKIHQRSCTQNNPAKKVGVATGMSATIGASEYSGRASARNSGSIASAAQTLYCGDIKQSTGTISGGSSGRGSSSSSRPGSSGHFGGGRDGDPYGSYPVTGNIEQCPTCGRTFAGASFIKHARVCQKVFVQKRRTFDSTKQRVQGTEMESFVSHPGRRSTDGTGVNRRGGDMGTSSKAGGSKFSSGATRTNLRVGSITSSGRSGHSGGGSAADNDGLPKWKADSMSFRNAMKQARLVSKAEKQAKETGVPLHMLLPAAQIIPESREQRDASALLCPHCGRTFSQKAGERHIPQCQFIINKPSRLRGHSGTPSYTLTNPPGGAGGGGAFGQSGGRGTSVNMGGAATRESFGNNTALRRGLSSTAPGAAFGGAAKSAGGGGAGSQSRSYNIATSNESSLNLFGGNGRW